MRTPTVNFIASLCATNVIFIVAIVLVCAVAVGAFIYGVFKRFTRMSWVGLQIPMIFGLTLLLGFLPKSMNSVLRFLLTVGGFLAITVVILFVGALIKRVFRKREDTRVGKPKAAARAFERLFGGIVALLDWLIFFAVLGGLGLTVVEAAGLGSALPVVYESAVWTGFFQKYAYDLFYISFLVLVIKGGYKLGFVKGIWVVLGLSLTVLAVFGSVWFTVRVPFMSKLALKIGATIKLNRIIADMIGYLITSFLCCIVCFIVIALIFVPINLLIKKMNKSTVFNVIDGCISSLLFFIVAMVFTLGIGAGVEYLANGIEGLGEYGEIFGSVGTAIRNVLTLSPFRGAIYESNPLLLLFG